MAELEAEDLDQLTDTALAQEILELQHQAARLEGQSLRRLAALDARGAAGADHGTPAPSTASWLRNRLRLGAGTAHDSVRTARALFRGPLPQTATALTDGEISPAHARVLANGTRHLSHHVAAEAEPILLEAARHLDPPLLRQAVGNLVELADPQGADAARQRRHERRGLWLAPTLDHMVAVKGLLEPEAGSIVRTALESLGRPADAGDDRNGDQRTADALTELCRRSLEGGQLPKAGGVRPQLLVTVDLDSLLGRPGALGGDTGWVGMLDREACRRLACDATVTRVLVSRHPDHPDHPGPEPGRRVDHRPGTDADPATDHGPGPSHGLDPDLDPGPSADLQGRLRAAMALLPRPWAAPPANPWTSAAAPASSSRPSARPWLCATAAVSPRVVIGRLPGVHQSRARPTPTISGTGSTAAPPTSRTSPWSAAPTIARSMRGVGS